MLGIAGTTLPILARSSRRTRAWLGVLVTLEVLGRGLLVVTAVAAGRSSPAHLFGVGLVTAGVYAAARAARSLVRVGSQCDLYRMTSRVVLDTDVLAVPATDIRRVVLDGTYHATLLTSQLAPAFVADCIVAIGIAPLLFATFSLRVLVMAALAVGATMGVASALRRRAEALEAGAALAWGSVVDTVVGGIESRVEIVARAGEDDFARGLDEQLHRYMIRVRRVGLISAFLGRAPLAAGALAVVAVVAFDSASKVALEGAVLGQALILLACFPPVRGAVFGALGMERSIVFVRPLIALLESPRRADITSPGGATVNLPVRVVGERLGFGYRAEAKPVICDLSFDWPVGEPLVLTGPNGAGKSTLFKLLLGLRAPSRGRILYGGRELGELDVRALRRNVAYLPQRPYLGEPYAEVRTAMKLAAPEATDAQMREALARTGVLDALARGRGNDALATPVGELSSGQRQRVALARTLLQSAPIVLLDEPDANLDREGIALVAGLVKELAGRGTMVAVAAHTPELASVPEHGQHRVNLEPPER